jgi:hypothetical protein
MEKGKIPQILNNFRAYADDGALLGTVDVELPELEAITEEIKGAGIAGTADMPIQGHYGALTLKLNWRTTTDAQLAMTAPKAHKIELRGSVQTYDSTNGTYATTPLKIVTKAIPKKTPLGKLASGEKMDAGNEFEVIYLKILLADKEWIELDKFNFIFKVDGKDYLESVRTDLGI